MTKKEWIKFKKIIYPTYKKHCETINVYWQYGKRVMIYGCKCAWTCICNDKFVFMYRPMVTKNRKAYFKKKLVTRIISPEKLIKIEHGDDCSLPKELRIFEPETYKREQKYDKRINTIYQDRM